MEHTAKQRAEIEMINKVNLEIQKTEKKLSELYKKRANKSGAPGTGWSYCPSGAHYTIGRHTCGCG